MGLPAFSIAGGRLAPPAWGPRGCGSRSQGSHCGRGPGDRLSLGATSLPPGASQPLRQGDCRIGGAWGSAHRPGSLAPSRGHAEHCGRSRARARGSQDRDALTILTATTGFGGRGVLRRGNWGSHPGAELLPRVGVASRPSPVAGPVVATKSGGPGAGRQQRAEAPGQASAGGRGEYEQRGQREEAERDERRGAAV